MMGGACWVAVGGGEGKGCGGSGVGGWVGGWEGGGGGGASERRTMIGSGIEDTGSAITALSR